MNLQGIMTGLWAALLACAGGAEPVSREPASGPPPMALPAEWEYTAPLIAPEQRGVESSVAQKDPSLVFHQGRCYCFYSGGNRQTPGYGVGFGVADSVTGPYRDEADLEGATVLKSVPGKVIGPGHSSVILGPDDRTHFIVYHSWNPERTKRQMCLDPLEWTDKGARAFEPARGKKRVTLPFVSR